MTYAEQRRIAVQREIDELRRLANQLGDAAVELRDIASESEHEVALNLDAIAAIMNKAQRDAGDIACRIAKIEVDQNSLDYKIDELDRLTHRGRYQGDLLNATLTSIARCSSSEFAHALGVTLPPKV